jgi:hypothetical protein
VIAPPAYTPIDQHVDDFHDDYPDMASDPTILSVIRDPAFQIISADLRN